MDSLSFLANMQSAPLFYPSIEGINQYTNVLLIDSQVNNYQQFVNSANATTFPIVYSVFSQKTELLALLQSNFASIMRVGLVFASTLEVPTMFLDCNRLFVDNEVEPYSENAHFLINVIKTFGVKNVDFLACNTLSYDNWTRFYSMLSQQTGVVVGASNDKTGNIKHGGDWIMESTSEDIEFVYFTQSIGYYQYLLDNPVWATGVDGFFGAGAFDSNYMYFPVYFGNRIVRINLDGTINNSTWATFGTQGVGQPQSCIIYNNYLYVANVYQSTISKISLSNPTTDYNATWATSTQGLSSPTGLIVYNDYLYVTNAGSATISKVSLTNPSGDYTVNWATSTQGLNTCTGIAFYKDYFYVINRGNNKVCKISVTNPTTDFNASWATTVFNAAPIWILIYGDYVYITNSSLNTISQTSLINPTTDFNETWATSAQGLASPMGMTQNDGYLYVFNYNATISQISLPALPPTPTLPCFKEGSKILTSNGYIPIEDLRNGDLVQTSLDGFKPINMIGKRVDAYELSSDRGKSQFYRCSKENYPDLFEDLVITGCHAILVDDFVSVEQREKVREILGKIYITDRKYRLPACVDNRALLYETPGKYMIYHLALENDNYYSNYGIYANGLLVESCSKRYLKELSNMELIE